MTSAEKAIDAVGRGKIVVVVDDEDRENEGDLIVAADAVDAETVAFFLEHTSGLICVGMDGERCDELGLPPMVDDNEEAQGTAFTVSVDLADGTTTGISADDRAVTVAALADPAARPEDFVRPGHVFPLRARPGGVLKRVGHTEAAVDLARLGGRSPAGMLCEIVTADKRSMARRDELVAFCDKHELPMVTIAELVRHRKRNDRVVEWVSKATIPTEHGEFTGHAWRSRIDGTEHMAMVLGDVRGEEPVLTRVHSECLTGDVFGSRRCDCGAQLDAAMGEIAAEGRGVLVYLRGHEGRGIGLAHKLQAYGLQDAGHDTVDANLMLGLPVDSREYGIGAQMLNDLGIRRMRLITNNPAKYSGLEGYGIEIVERIGVALRPTPENVRYLHTKRDRMGHLMPLESVEPPVSPALDSAETSS
jgi:3,4-dihydroxy 2-butanone 4-phosphate synthase/GTP cyclohydrolase II